jgi:hypothetical protein
VMICCGHVVPFEISSPFQRRLQWGLVEAQHL